MTRVTGRRSALPDHPSFNPSARRSVPPRRGAWVWAGVLAFGACSDGSGGASETTSGSGTSTSTSTGAATTDPGGDTAGDTAQPTTTLPGTSATGTGTTEPVVTVGGTDTSSGSGSSTGGGGPCDACPVGFICKYEQCLPNLGTCTTNDDCPGDSYCDKDGQCIPYGVPPEVINDPNCQKQDIPEGVTPVVQCEWSGPADPNDKTKSSVSIYTTPLVADLNLDKDPHKLQPSIIVNTFYTGPGTRIGMLRIFDGRTCTEQLRAGGADEADSSNRPAYGAGWTIGDLDGDVPMGGHPELVSYHLGSDAFVDPVQLYAMRIDSSGKTPILKRMWYGRDCADGDKILEFGGGDGADGPELLDLDDDGIPEILVGEQVFDAKGCVLTTWNAATAVTSMSYAADVDLDGEIDLVTANRVAGWNKVTTEWVDKPWFTKDPLQLAGQIAVADLGLFSAIKGVDVAKQPEAVVLSSPGGAGRVRIQSLAGTIVWGPMDLYKTGNPANHGGPLTISDFDGDGQVEFASAGANQYVVYDPDCAAAPLPERPGGVCERAPEQQAKNLPDGVLWAQPSQDKSSNATGSSIFDFNGDGAGEAVYRDECYVRVYSGKSGEVLFSAPASSGTGREYPAIADVDGDFATEIVVPRADNGGGCPAVDPLFPGSGAFYVAAGFVVYRDPLDRWANSRPVWNQHAYSVTHVTDDAQIPKTSAFVDNWLAPGLNNFRQNTQGSVGLLKLADLTVELIDLGKLCEFGGGDKQLQAEVCNRGTNPVQDGVVVEFLETDDPNKPVEEAVVVCTTATTKVLYPGECEVVMCDAVLGGKGNIFVDVDPDDKIADCHPGNNLGADAFEVCPG